MTPPDADDDRHRLTVVTFNGWVANPDWRGNVHWLANDTDRPHAIVAQEAKRFHGTIRGYTRHACDRKGPRHRECGSTIVLVRNDVRVTRERYLHVDGPDWRGPKHGLRHNPRTFPDLTLKADGQKWDLLAVHRTPGGPEGYAVASWTAEHREIVAWADRRAHRRKPRPLLVVGDHNDRKGGRHVLGLSGLADDIDADLAVRGIDGALIVRAKGRARELDDYYGSDAHQPVVVTARIRQ